jgi:hypothetical protein
LVGPTLAGPLFTWVPACQPHDMPILVSSSLLKPLGNPPQNGVKFFSTAEVAEMAKDRAWLAKTTQAIGRHWHKRNVRQKSHARNGSENGQSVLLNAPKVASGYEIGVKNIQRLIVGVEQASGLS